MGQARRAYFAEDEELPEDDNAVDMSDMVEAVLEALTADMGPPTIGRGIVS